jgi:hypothetical protein
MTVMEDTTSNRIRNRTLQYKLKTKILIPRYTLETKKIYPSVRTCLNDNYTLMMSAAKVGLSGWITPGIIRGFTNPFPNN